ncbi:unnamed protein product [Effrenium voratum]|nr:unnamed protein product [Effrenium voratum]
MASWRRSGTCPSQLVLLWRCPPFLPRTLSLASQTHRQARTTGCSVTELWRRTAGQTAAGEESEVVEEIVLEGPNRTSSEPPQATPVHPAVASTRPRASISELFRLPLSELQARKCEAEGIPVAPGEAKGLLISKLKQALSKTAAQAADSAKQVAEAQLDSPKKATDSQPEALTKPEPSPKAEPEVFHIGSDDETDNHSDDFFPEFPTFSTTIPGATSASSEALPQELPTVLPEQSQPNAEFDIGDLQEDLADIHSDHTPKASGRDCFDWFNDEEEVLPKSKSAPGQVHATSPGSEASEKPSNSSDPQIDLPEPAATTPLQHFEDAKDRGDGSSSDRGDGAMFDFDDLDDLVKVNPLAADPAPEPTRPTPDRPEESEVEPEPKVAEPKAPKEEARPEPPVQPAPEQESPPRGNENPLLKFTTKELLELARSRGVDVRGCVEKSDIVDRLTRAPRAPQPPVQHKPPVRQNTQPMQTQSAGAPSKASGAPMPRFGRSYTWQGGHGHASHASQPPSQPPVSQSSTTAPRRPAKAHASKAGRRQPKAPSPTPEAPRWENLSSWSSRVQTWFNRYPGFTAMLPPEAEMWTDQELDAGALRDPAINFLERHIGVDIDGDGDIGSRKVVHVAEAVQDESEEEDDVILEPEKDAARRAFAMLLEREGSFPESSDSSSEEEAEVARRSRASETIRQIRLPESIRDQYTFLELLNENHGRRVYLCKAHREESGENRCVLKVWYKQWKDDAELATIMQGQLDLLKLERHANIVQPQHILEDELCFYVEFDGIFAGSSLFQNIIADASLTEKWIKRVFRGIFRGLAHLHENGWTHGDLKPENVLLEWKDFRHLLSKHAKHPKAWHSVKKSVARWSCPTHFKTAWTRHQLVAFARIIDLDTASRSPRGICGTPGYMAPEEYVGPSSPAGDLFAVGVMLYQLIRCACPFHDVVFRVLQGRALDAASAHTREQIAAAVSSAVSQIDWGANPWPFLPKARDLCQQLLQADSRQRGGTAATVLTSSPWLNRRVGRHLKKLVRKATTQISGPSPTSPTSPTFGHAACRRHYRRLARDCHPDKHPDNVEEATRRLGSCQERVRNLFAHVGWLQQVATLRQRVQELSSVPVYEQHLICGNTAGA